MKYINGKKLLEELFDDESRPTSAWLYYLRRRGKIPYVKIGGTYFYDLEKVKEALNK